MADRKRRRNRIPPNRGRRRRRRLAEGPAPAPAPFRGPPPGPKAQSAMAAKVENQRALGHIARAMPTQFKGHKRMPPHALIPPGPGTPKNHRFQWARAARIAEANAENEGDLS